MSRNFVYDGEHFNYTAGATITSGDLVPMTDMVGLALSPATSGTTIAVRTEGVAELAKLSTDVITQGQIVYWDNTNKRITTTSAGNTRAGKAYAAAGNGATKVQVKLNV